MSEQEISMEEARRRGRWVMAWQDESGKELRSLVIPDPDSALEPIGIQTADTPLRVRNVRTLAAPIDTSDRRGALLDLVTKNAEGEWYKQITINREFTGVTWLTARRNGVELKFPLEPEDCRHLASLLLAGL